MTIAPYWEDGQVTLYLGDCLAVMREMPDASVDAVVTDPPAAIRFMGRSWDGDRGGRDRWIAWLAERMAEALRVLKPGGHALVWALPRTSGWTQMALEDAGFEVRDCIVHIFGSGFPKSLDVSAAIDKAAGAVREVIAEGVPVRRMIPGADQNRTGSWIKDNGREFVPTETIPATEDAACWQGWGTALKPGQEIWWLARKPLAGTVASNVLAYGTGALNIAGCRVQGGSRPARSNEASASGLTGTGGATAYGSYAVRGSVAAGETSEGRWPPNIVLTHSAGCEPKGTRKVRNRSGSVSADVPSRPVDVIFGDCERVGWRAHGAADGLESVEAWDCAADCPVAELDRQSGRTSGGNRPARRGGIGYGSGAGGTSDGVAISYDSGGASRFFPGFRYQAKAPASERPRGEDGTAHETVKSLGLMRWLVRLITPGGGVVLDCFAGSGTTAEACIVEGFGCVLIDDEQPHADLIRVRLSKAIQPVLFGLEES